MCGHRNMENYIVKCTVFSCGFDIFVVSMEINAKTVFDNNNEMFCLKLSDSYIRQAQKIFYGNIYILNCKKVHYHCLINFDCWCQLSRFDNAKNVWHLKVNLTNVYLKVYLKPLPFPSNGKSAACFCLIKKCKLKQTLEFKLYVKS